MCKTTNLFQHIVKQYNPVFANLSNAVRKHPQVINIEHLIELTMAHVGGYEFTDEAHCDFSDGSECKTASVRKNPIKPGSISYSLEISNVVSQSGTLKSGPVRVVLYNPHTKVPTYYYIPQNRLQSVGINRHPTTGVGRIFANWNSVTNSIRKLDPYKVDTFDQLASM